MLILQRRIGQIINIGDDIEIIFLQRKGNTIKLGVKAPFHVNVWRNEIYTAIKNKTDIQNKILESNQINNGVEA